MPAVDDAVFSRLVQRCEWEPGTHPSGSLFNCAFNMLRNWARVRPSVVYSLPFNIAIAQGGGRLTLPSGPTLPLRLWHELYDAVALEPERYMARNNTASTRTGHILLASETTYCHGCGACVRPQAGDPALRIASHIKADNQAEHGFRIRMFDVARGLALDDMLWAPPLSCHRMRAVCEECVADGSMDDCEVVAADLTARQIHPALPNTTRVWNCCGCRTPLPHDGDGARAVVNDLMCHTCAARHRLHAAPFPDAQLPHHMALAERQFDGQVMCVWCCEGNRDCLREDMTECIPVVCRTCHDRYGPQETPFSAAQFHVVPPPETHPLVQAAEEDGNPVCWLDDIDDVYLQAHYVLPADDDGPEVRFVVHYIARYPYERDAIFGSNATATLQNLHDMMRSCIEILPDGEGRRCPPPIATIADLTEVSSGTTPLPLESDVSWSDGEDRVQE